MMKIIIDKNTNLEKEKIIVSSLIKDIEEDKLNKDLKSFKYHSMALEEHKKVLKELEKECEDLCQSIN